MFVPKESHCMPIQIILHVSAEPSVIIVDSPTAQRCFLVSGAPPQLSPSRAMGARLLCPFNSWPMGQCVERIRGVWPLGVQAGRGKKKQQKNARVEAVMLQEMWSMLFPGRSRSLMELSYTHSQFSGTASHC